MSHYGNPRTADRLLPGDTAMEDVRGVIMLLTKRRGDAKRVNGAIVTYVPADLMAAHEAQFRASVTAMTNHPVTFEVIP